MHVQQSQCCITRPARNAFGDRLPTLLDCEPPKGHIKKPPHARTPGLVCRDAARKSDFSRSHTFSRACRLQFVDQRVIPRLPTCIALDRTSHRKLNYVFLGV
jgi:hypothetical protein